MGWRSIHVIVLSLVAGCGSFEATEIFLTVDSDLVVSSDAERREVDHILVRVYRLDLTTEDAPVLHETRGMEPETLEENQRVRIDRYVYEHRWSHQFVVPPERLPIEVGVAPAGGDPDRTAYFEALAIKDGRIVLRTAVRTRFVRRRAVRVVLWLNASCVGVECPPESVCFRAGCVPVEIDEDCLPGRTEDGGFACYPDGGTSCQPACLAGQQCVGGACLDTDRDRDGVITRRDCDDDDASVGATATRDCTAPCGMPATETCTEGAWGECELAGCECAAGATRVVPCGACMTQNESCTGGVWTADGACTSGCAIANGTGACVDGACAVASCDAGFDDCNGDVVDGCETDLSTPMNCGACGAMGTEICNGMDDDCDAMRDEGFQCRQGQSGACTTSCSSNGTRNCRADCTWGGCNPPGEQCGNGRDDDCDGQTDEGCCGPCGGSPNGAYEPGRNVWSACNNCGCGDCAACCGTSCGGCGACVPCYRTCNCGTWVDDAWCAGRASDC